jgi:hypothetical protein
MVSLAKYTLWNISKGSSAQRDAEQAVLFATYSFSQAVIAF